MHQFSRRALFNLALHGPAALAAVAAVALLLLNRYAPAIAAAGLCAGWVIVGAALTLLFEPALTRLLSEE